MKQTIGNACGTIGVLHALANNLSCVSLGVPFPNHPPQHAFQMLPRHTGPEFCHESGLFLMAL